MALNGLMCADVPLSNYSLTIAPATLTSDVFGPNVTDPPRRLKFIYVGLQYPVSDFLLLLLLCQIKTARLLTVQGETQRSSQKNLQKEAQNINVRLLLAGFF